MLRPYVHGTGKGTVYYALKKTHDAPLEGYSPLYVPKTGEILNT
jgi:hypothetical protein